MLTAIAAALLHSPALRADAVIAGYQFTNDSFNPTTLDPSLAASSFTYVNANPGNPPLGPAFIIQGGILPDDPAFFVGQADWFPTALGYNQNYYTFAVSVSPGAAINVNSLSFYANSRQQVPFLAQVQYSTSPNFTNPVSFDTNPIAISSNESWATYTASDAPIVQGTGTWYFRIYNQLDINGNGTIADLFNMSRVALNGSVVNPKTPTPLYWDPAHAGAPGSGGDGIWLSGAPWADGPIDYSWNPALPETAVFAGPASGNVTLGGNVSATSGISFLTSGYTISANANQTLTLGGTLNVSAAAALAAPFTTAAPGPLYKTGGEALFIEGPGALANGTSLIISLGGLVVQSGGSIVANGAPQIVGQNPGDDGNLGLVGNGSFSTDNAIILADQGGNGTLLVQDSAALSANSLLVGNGSLANAAVILNGGTLSANAITLAADHTATGSITLNAGTLATASITGGLGNSMLLLAGGTLQASANSTSLLSNITNLQVSPAGALIDTNGFNVSLAQPLTPASGSNGGLTKLGAGTLTLNFPTPLAGPIAVNAGTLKSVNNTFPSANISIAANATLEYNLSARTFQTPTTFTGNGTLRLTASPTGQLVFGGYGAVNVNFSPGALIDIQSGLLYASSS
ncbi:MAG: hypothetical protein ACTHN5_14720 [Phycisphaerae bacterium]